MAQTSYTQDPAAAYPGMPADDGPKRDSSTVAEEAGGIDPGLVVVRGTGGDKTARLIPEVAADADGIITSTATSTSEQALTDADADGALGAGPYVPPKKLTLTLDSSVDWDATTATIVYEDENGVQQTESLSIPDGGDTVLTTTGYAREFVSLTIPAQSGTGGSFTLGVAAEATLEGGDVIGVSIRTHKARDDGSVDDAQVYLDEEEMPVRDWGRVYVEVENAFEAGDRVLVRCIAGTGEKLGAVRVGDDDGGDCFEWSRARLRNSGGAGALGLLEVYPH